MSESEQNESRISGFLMKTYEILEVLEPPNPERQIQPNNQLEPIREWIHRARYQGLFVIGPPVLLQALEFPVFRAPAQHVRLPQDPHSKNGNPVHAHFVLSRQEAPGQVDHPQGLKEDGQGRP
jgi:hypothetical protein